jgi:hypothetical protein
LARDWPQGTRPVAFPDFERFYSGDFPPGTPIEVCCVYQFRHVRRRDSTQHRTLTENDDTPPANPVSAGANRTKGSTGRGG